MAYEKQTWQTGDVITQEKLNHMEDGIANAESDSVRTTVTLKKFTGSIDASGNTSIKVSAMNGRNDDEGLSFADLKALYQDHDILIIDDCGDSTNSAPLIYQEAAPSWGVAAHFRAEIVSISTMYGKINVTKIDISETQQTAVTTEYKLSLTKIDNTQ